MFIGILISLAAAITKIENTSEDGAKPQATVTTPTSITDKKSTKSLKDTQTKSATRSSKSLRMVTDNRGKRTLYDFGNAGYLYSDIANRRAGYSNDAPQNYYSQTGFFNGQGAVAQFPSGYSGHYTSYPHYLEAPEPIIEIIIKDSNETIPTEPPQPIITKKKKEKVHVFYVNYKKDHNNKLHLESPIASLNNDDTTEEEEEIVQIPQPVTPLPLRTTTLRTIIHPDSEKYHSNSGIHVTFGTEDKQQTGHVLEENNAESIQRQVVALPAGSNPSALNGLKTDNNFQIPAQARSPNDNQLIEEPFQRTHYYQTQPQPQLPLQRPPQYFGTYNTFSNKQQLQTAQKHESQPQPLFFQKLPLTQTPAFTQAQAPLLPQPQALYRKPPTTQQQIQQHQQQQQTKQQSAQYYSNYNQQFYQPLSHKPTLAPKSSFVFPTVPHNTQELPSKQTPAPYQPIKFRPTQAPMPQIKPVPIPVKLENAAQQYKTQPQYQKSQQNYQHKSSFGASSSPYYFNRQPQFVRQPSFSLPSPTIPSTYKPQKSHISNQYTSQKETQSSSAVNYYQPDSNGQNTPKVQNYVTVNYNQQFQQQSHQQQQQQQRQQKQQHQSLISATIPSTASYSSFNNQHASTLSAVHNYFDIQPSKETELLKSIPKFEQHITETIHHPVPPQQTQAQPQGVYTNYAYSSNRNQVIHDIPAPNLGPTPQPLNRQQPTPVNGHYITASNLQTSVDERKQYNNFVTMSLPSSTPVPQYAETTNGQKVMIVTPMPPIIYNQYHSSQFSDQGKTVSSNQQQTVQHYEHQNTGHNNYVQQPRQSQTSVQAAASSQSSQTNSQFGVSTHHSDVFRELEQRKQQQEQLDSQRESKKGTENYQVHTQEKQQQQVEAQRTYVPPNQSTASNQQQNSQNAHVQDLKSSQTFLQLPDEVPDDLRQQLLSSGILNNADISVLDYDKVGAVNLENLPAEHLQHFYGAGGGAQISESNKVLTVVKPNGEQVSLSEKDLEHVKTSNSVPKKHNLDVKVVRFDANNQKSVTDKYLKIEATIVPPVNLADKQYNRYLPLKINGEQFPIPDTEELRGKKVVSVVVLAPVENDSNGEARSGNNDDAKEVKFYSGDLIKTLVKKPTKENFKRWLDKEAKTEIEQQSVILLVAKSTDSSEQEIFMYDITTGAINKLNGELSSKFVSVAEENASTEDLGHASTLDPTALEQMMQPSTSHS